MQQQQLAALAQVEVALHVMSVYCQQEPRYSQRHVGQAQWQATVQARARSKPSIKRLRVFASSLRAVLPVHRRSGSTAVMRLTPYGAGLSSD